jgi:hypothetical protein
VPEQSNTQRRALQTAGQLPGVKSASRRRAVAALWRAAKAEGLAQSKTLREYPWSRPSAPAFWSAAALLRHFPGKLLIGIYLSFFDKKNLTNGIDWLIVAT